MLMIMDWKHRTAARSDWHQVLNRIFIGLVLSCVFHYAESRWCTKTESYKTVRPMVVRAKCNQTYQEDCGWFTSAQCTRYEMVECMKEQNQTITRYKITTSCCPGFKLDPINNITCIVDESHPQEALRNGGGGTGKAGLKKLVSGDKAEPLTDVKGGADKTVEAQRTKQEEDKGILASLSSGAYTGIICALVFVMCVLALIGVHFMKKQRRLKSKSDGEAIGMDATQKMLKA